MDDINNPDFTLFYSLKKLNYHVNPVLEYDMDKENDSWYFKEYTKAYHYDLLTKM